jgi:hypothetical protein
MKSIIKINENLLRKEISSTQVSRFAQVLDEGGEAKDKSCKAFSKHRILQETCCDNSHEDT